MLQSSVKWLQKSLHGDKFYFHQSQQEISLASSVVVFDDAEAPDTIQATGLKPLEFEIEEWYIAKGIFYQFSVLSQQ